MLGLADRTGRAGGLGLDDEIGPVSRRESVGRRDLLADADSPVDRLIARAEAARPKPGSRLADRSRSGATRASKRSAPGGGSSRSMRRLPRKALIAGGAVVIVVIALAVALLVLPQPTHVISDPATLGGYVKQPTGADATAAQLKQKIIAGAPGEVKNVVAAVYERKTGPGTSTGPQIVVFIGGNLTGGGSASGLIDGFKARLHGSFTTSAGSLGGQAACAPGSNGGPAECIWADGDTFGVIVSATLNASGLAGEMRQMRPLVEHVAH